MADDNAKPQQIAGPNDTRPTAHQIIESEGFAGKLSDDVVLITGSSSGIGVETAKAMYETGATLFLPVRDLGKAQASLGRLVASDRVHLVQMDLESLASVRACASHVLSKTATLNTLICNAGLMTPHREETQDGFEKHFGVNHLAHFLLFTMLQPALAAGVKSGRCSRVIMLSSIAHRFAEFRFDDINYEHEYNGMLAYGRSKTANLWTANQIERIYGGIGIHAWSVDPGAITTGLTRNLSAEDKRADENNPVKLAVIKTPAQGAATSVWAAVAKELEGKGGGYLEDVGIAKQWDALVGPWGPGYASYAMDQEKETLLWDKSLELIN